MMDILLYSHNPLRQGLIGAIGAFITYLVYLGISFVISYLRNRINRKNNTTNAEVERPSDSCAVKTDSSLQIPYEGNKENVYCKNCGKYIDSDAVFCPYCGKEQTMKNATTRNNEGFYSVSKTFASRVISFLRIPSDYVKSLTLNRMSGDGLSKWRINKIYLFLGYIFGATVIIIFANVYINAEIEESYDDIQNDINYGIFENKKSFGTRKEVYTIVSFTN